MLEAGANPTALFCFSDEMAIGALSALRSRGLKCPDHISIAGFDDVKIAKYINPLLTTISQPMRDLGRQAFNILDDILSGRNAGLVSVTLPHKLVIRESTSSPQGKL
jgi:LacI family repressor for deo operon, udp, cdd, tsx, nupC, and nupG